MKSIKRVAGASAGAIIATLIALGYDSRELREFLEQDLRRILVGELTECIIILLCNVSSCWCEKADLTMCICHHHLKLETCQDPETLIETKTIIFKSKPKTLCFKNMRFIGLLLVMLAIYKQNTFISQNNDNVELCCCCFLTVHSE